MEWADITASEAWDVWTQGFIWGMGFVVTFLIIKLVRRLRSVRTYGVRD